MTHYKVVELNNDFHVAKRQWDKWNPLCRKIFNHVYEVMLGNQTLFLHPEALTTRKRFWKTTAWNAAWEAAEACKRSLKEL
jgi:hypothetical protein